MMARLMMALFLLVISLVPSFFYFGPTVEARVLPVLGLGAVDIRFGTVEYEGTERQVMFFKTHAVKYRPCQLDIFSFRWLLDHSVAVTPVFVAEDNLPFQPNSVITVGEFTSRELWTLIPPAAYNYPTTTFRGTAFFKCHSLWPLAFYFEIKVEIPDLDEKRSEIKRLHDEQTLLASRTRFHHMMPAFVSPPKHGGVE